MLTRGSGASRCPRRPPHRRRDRAAQAPSCATRGTPPRSSPRRARCRPRPGGPKTRGLFRDAQAMESHAMAPVPTTAPTSQPRGLLSRSAITSVTRASPERGHRMTARLDVGAPTMGGAVKITRRTYRDTCGTASHSRRCGGRVNARSAPHLQARAPTRRERPCPPTSAAWRRRGTTRRRCSRRRRGGARPDTYLKRNVRSRYCDRSPLAYFMGGSERTDVRASGNGDDGRLLEHLAGPRDGWLLARVDDAGDGGPGARVGAPHQEDLAPGRCVVPRPMRRRARPRRSRPESHKRSWPILARRSRTKSGVAMGKA